MVYYKSNNVFIVQQNYIKTFLNVIIKQQFILQTKLKN